MELTMVKVNERSGAYMGIEFPFDCSDIATNDFIHDAIVKICQTTGKIYDFQSQEHFERYLITMKKYHEKNSDFWSKNRVSDSEMQGYEKADLAMSSNPMEVIKNSEISISDREKAYLDMKCEQGLKDIEIYHSMGLNKRKGEYMKKSLIDKLKKLLKGERDGNQDVTLEISSKDNDGRTHTLKMIVREKIEPLQSKDISDLRYRKVFGQNVERSNKVIKRKNGKIETVNPVNTEFKINKKKPVIESKGNGETRKIKPYVPYLPITSEIVGMPSAKPENVWYMIPIGNYNKSAMVNSKLRYEAEKYSRSHLPEIFQEKRRLPAACENPLKNPAFVDISINRNTMDIYETDIRILNR